MGHRGTQEPCAICGEETAAGSAFYSDRRATELPNGEAAWICPSCAQRRVRSGRGSPVTEDEAQRLTDNLSAGVMGWPSYGGGG